MSMQLTSRIKLILRSTLGTFSHKNYGLLSQMSFKSGSKVKAAENVIQGRIYEVTPFMLKIRGVSFRYSLSTIWRINTGLNRISISCV